MTKISRRQLPTTKMSAMIEQLWRSIALLDNKQQVRDFLHDILTSTEIQMVAKRLAVVVMLDEGLTYAEIGKRLNISEATITKIQHWRTAFGQGYNLVIEKLNKEKTKRRSRSSKMSSKRAAAEMFKF